MRDIVAKPRPKRESKIKKLDQSRAPGTVIDRQSIERRLDALRRSINDDLKRLKSALNAGRTDRATTLCALVANKRADFLGLADRLNQSLSMDHLPDPQRPPAKSPFRTIVKQKRYKRFSDD